MNDHVEEKASNYLQQIKEQYNLNVNAKSKSLDRLIEKTHQIFVKGDRAQIGVLGDIIKRAKTKEFQNLREDVAPLFAAIAGCFEVFGMYVEAVAFAKQAIDACGVNSRSMVARRAHNSAATCYLRICNLERATYHLNQSLEIAIDQKDALGQLATLSNVVSLLDAMDVPVEALDLCIKLKDEICDHPISPVIKFQNSINGGFLSARSRDLVSLSMFNRESASHFKKVIGLVPDVWLAQYYANKIVFMAWTGRSDRACRVVDRLIRAKSKLNNQKINCILVWAKAVCCNETTHKRFVAATRRDVIKLMKVFELSSFYYVALIVSLIPLYKNVSKLRSTAARNILFARLQRYQVTVKHARHFLSPVAPNFDIFTQESYQLQNPTYDFPGGLSNYMRDHLVRKEKESSIAYTVDDRRPLLSSYQTGTKTLLRSERYDVAENWAVAAEFAAGIKAGFCFKVGAISRLIARTKGWSNQDCEALELACRLHDLGSVVINPVISKAVVSDLLDSDCIGREDTWAGYFLLSGSHDPVLSLASKIALSHREWFNGCGYPQGLRGDEIPVEARICAVAREYCSLIERFGDSPARYGQALAQCQAMADVQLDSSLVMALVGVMTEDSGLNERRKLDWDGVRKNEFFQAKLRLSKSVSRALAS